MHRSSLLAALLALAVPATAHAAVRNGSYRGTTDEDRTVFVTVKRGAITDVRFSLNTRCGIGGSGGFLTDAVSIQKRIPVKGGKFRYEQKGDGSNGKSTFVLQGTASGTKITGTLKDFFRGGCRAFDIKFSAKRR
jgi:hypothetical protein